jgi:hypothetical protein
MTRTSAGKLGWQFVADQPGYVRAEKMTPSGELINMQGETEDLVFAQIDAWESYPVQAPNSRTNELESEVAPEPVVEEAPVKALPADEVAA